MEPPRITRKQVKLEKPSIVNFARKLLAQNINLEGALASLNVVLAIDGRDTEVLLLKSQCLVRLEEFDEAAACIRKCERLLGQDKDVERAKQSLAESFEWHMGYPMDWNSFRAPENVNEPTDHVVTETQTNETDNDWLASHRDLLKCSKKGNGEKVKRSSKKRSQKLNVPRENGPIHIDIAPDQEICDNAPKKVLSDTDKNRPQIRTEKEQIPDKMSARKKRKKINHQRVRPNAVAAGTSTESTASETSSLKSQPRQIDSEGTCQGSGHAQEFLNTNDQLSDCSSNVLKGETVKESPNPDGSSNFDEGIGSTSSQTSDRHQFTQSAGGGASLDDARRSCPYPLTVVCRTCWMRNGQQYGRSAARPDYCSNPREPVTHRWNTNNKTFLVKTNRCGSSKWIQVRPVVPNATKPTQMCKFARDCREDKRCSFPHSEEEASLWSFQLRFNVKSDEDLEVLCMPISSEVKTSADRFRERCDSGASTGSIPSTKPQPLFHQEMKETSTLEKHRQPGIHCDMCPNKEFHSYRDLDAHYTSEEHRSRQHMDDDRFWKFRSPPFGIVDPSDLQMCPSVHRGDVPLHQTLCEMAHCVEELSEWKARVEYRQMKSGQRNDRHMHFLQQISDDLGDPGIDHSSVVMEDTEGTQILLDGKCDVNLDTRQENDLHFRHRFSFEVLQGKRELRSVGLLLNPCRQFFNIEGDIKPNEKGNVQVLSSEEISFFDGKFNVTVTFAARRHGIYNQWVIFDFGEKPVVVKRLLVTIGDVSEGNFHHDILLKTFRTPLEESLRHSSEHFGEGSPRPRMSTNPFLECQMISWWDYEIGSHTTNSMQHNLRRKLFLQALQEEDNLSRLVIRGEISRSDDKNNIDTTDVTILVVNTHDIYDAADCVYRLFYEGAFQTVAVYAEDRVRDGPYYAKIRERQTINGSGSLHLEMQERCANELGVTNGLKVHVTCRPVFRSHTFARLKHWLGIFHGDTVFTYQEQTKQDSTDDDGPRRQGSIYGLDLDSDQTEALLRMCDHNKGKVLPVILCGPKGSGRSRLLDVATAVLMKKSLIHREKRRVFICTNSTSCALVHLKNVRHFLSEGQIHHVRSVAILPRGTCMEAAHQSLDDELKPFITTVEEYQKTSAGGTVHDVVITTARCSADIITEKGNVARFTDVFIDEAGQTDSLWSVPPIALAGSGARIVVAGELTKCESCRVRRKTGSTLDEFMKVHEGTPKGPESVIYLQNSHNASKPIADYVDGHVYGNNDVQPVEDAVVDPRFNALGTVIPMKREGKECMETLESWQVLGAVYHVEQICHTWPSDFQDYRENGICIIAEDHRLIDDLKLELKRRHLSFVSVENTDSVQGKEFTVVLFMSSVENNHLTKPSDVCYRSLFAVALSRARKMFTVITSPNIQSQCSANDERSQVLQDFFKYCFERDSILSAQAIQLCDIGPEEPRGQYLPSDSREDGCSSEHEIEQGQQSGFRSDTGDVVMTPAHETCSVNLEDIFFPYPRVLATINDSSQHGDYRHDGSEKVDDSVNPYDYHDDDDEEEEEEEYHSDIDSPPEDYDASEDNGTIENALFKEYSQEKCNELLQEQPEKYKRCRLETRIHDKDKAVPIGEDLEFEIRIPKKSKRGRAWGQDIVVIELMDEDESDDQDTDDGLHIRYGCVVGILQRHEDPRYKTVICNLDEFSDAIMVPVNGNFPKMIWWTDRPRSSDVVRVPIYKITKYGRRVFQRFEDVENSERPHKVFITRFVKWDINNRYPACIVTGVFPEVSDMTSGLRYLKAKHDIVESFKISQAIEGHAKKSDRKDLTHLPAFTIDPVDSSDLDDALSIQQMENGNYEVSVHIADVASQVPPGSELDEAAYKRGTSYYPPGEVPIPMLPKTLSTNLCSLLPNKDRNAISFVFEVGPSGKVVEMSDVVRSVIKSRRKLSYEDAESIILQQEQRDDNVEVQILQLHEVAQGRRKTRLGKAYFLTESNSYDEDEENAPLSHHLVEEMMIMVNTEVAKWLRHVYPNTVPLRRQLPPSKEKLQHWYTAYADLLNCSVKLSSKLAQQGHTDNNTPTPRLKVLKAFAEILEKEIQRGNLEKVKQKLCDDSFYPELHLMNLKLYEILNRGEYVCSDSNKTADHFDLKAEAYIRCTSPIRRYMDLIEQRFILARLDGFESPYNKEEVNSMCAACNQVEDKQKGFARDCKELELALKLSQNPVKAYAVVEEASESSINLRVMKVKNNLSKERRQPLGLLKVADKPHMESDGTLLLGWREKVYDCRTEAGEFVTKGAAKGKVVSLRRDCHYICESAKDFQTSLRHFLKNDKENTRQFLEKMLEKSHRGSRASQSVEAVTSERWDEKGNRLDPCTFSRKFQTGDVLRVQLGAQDTRGSICPSIDLICLSRGFDICKEHRRDPVRCFSDITSEKVRGLEARREGTIEDYQRAWLPILSMCAADNSARHCENYIIHNVQIKWRKSAEDLTGEFSLPRGFCESRGIKFIAYKNQESHDYICVRHQPNGRNGAALKWGSGDMLDKNFCWVGHCVVTGSYEKDDGDGDHDENGFVEVEIRLHQTKTDVIHDMCDREKEVNLSCTIEVIQKATPDRRTEETVYKLADGNTCDLVKNICLGIPPTRLVPRGCRIRLVILGMAKYGDNSNRFINEEQTNAIKKALEQPFTVIQGPPGTGKSFTAAFLAKAFTIVNRTEQDGSRIKKLLYCAPSNKAVDVAAEYLKIFDLDVIRMYSKSIEGQTFKVPGWTDKMQLRKEHQAESNPDHALMSLHHVIRKADSTYGWQIRDFDKKFNDRKVTKVSEKDYKAYKALIYRAEREALGKCEIILCTCSEAASRRLAGLHVGQCIIDEAGMCTEPETLVPLVRTNPEQIVLIGDQRQLQPVVTHNLSKQLGLSASLLERYCDQDYFFRLKKQYRMHPGICEFPNKRFYDGDLETAKEVLRQIGKPSKIDKFWPGGPQNPIVFCHVVGKEVTLTVTNEEGSEQSKKNLEEIAQVVRLTKLLTSKRYGIPKSRIQILSQYNSQCFQLKQDLRRVNCQGVAVNSVTGFQGSEKDYVIISTVRSLPLREIEDFPTKGWLKKNLGFVTDDHQTNVALTRPRKGLIIVGNKNLLKTDPTWKALIKHCEDKKCVVDALSFHLGGLNR